MLLSPLRPATESPLRSPLQARVGGSPSLDAQIAAIYAAGRLGPWFDVSDLSTMYTTRAGMTNVGTPGDGTAHFVGRLEDKSQGRVLGPELVGGASFVDASTGPATASWVGGVLTLDANTATSRGRLSIPTVANKSYRVTFRRVLGGADATLDIGTTAGGATIAASVLVSTSLTTIVVVATTATTWLNFYRGATTPAVTIDNISVRELPGYHALAANDTTARPQLSARVNLFLATATLSTQSVTTVATNYTLAFSGAGSITLSGTATGTYSAGSHTVTCTAGTLTATVSGTVTNADLRPTDIHAAGSIPAYQRVTSAEDYDSVGFPYRLIPNGTGQALQTSLITPGTDSVTVGVGVRKLSDAAASLLMEYTAISTTLGSFYISAPVSAGATLDFHVRGSVAPAPLSLSALAAPITSTLVVASDISSGLRSISRNNGAPTTSSAGLGTGNFATDVLNLFSRNGASLWFGGHYFCQITLFGPQLTAGELATVEAWINSKTKAY